MRELLGLNDAVHLGADLVNEVAVLTKETVSKRTVVGRNRTT